MARSKAIIWPAVADYTALVQCKDCRHFERSPYHPRVGECGVGVPAAPAGFWDTDRRWCGEYVKA